MTVYGPYSYTQMGKIFSNTDILVVPSVWKETFGFIALEAKSYGVPTIISSNVGAKDCFTNGIDTIIIEPNSKSLGDAIKRIVCEKNLLQKMNKAILKEDIPYQFSTHVNKIIYLYKKEINQKNRVTNE